MEFPIHLRGFLLLFILILLSIHERVVESKSTHESNKRQAQDAGAKPEEKVPQDFPPEQTDPCDFFVCDFGQECRVGHDSKPACVCRAFCPQSPSKVHGSGSSSETQGGYDYEADFFDFQVCGNDGILYPSECELHRTACLTANPNLHIVGFGPEPCSKEEEEELDQNENDDNGPPQDVFPVGSQYEVEEEDEENDGLIKKTKSKRGSSLCNEKEYEIFKEALLVYNREGTRSSNNGKAKGKGKVLHLDLKKNELNEINSEEDQDIQEELLSLIFGHFDNNHDGQLDYAELQRIGLEENLGRSLVHCHPVDFLHFDDTNGDGRISPSEFENAFNTLHRSQQMHGRKEKKLQNITGMVGQALKLECPHLILPTFGVVEWTRYGHLIGDNNMEDYGIRIFQQGGKSVLSIPSLEMKHAGNFSCKNEGGKKDEFVVNVMSKPQVEVRPKIIVQHPGEEVKLECRAKGEPQPTIKWLKNETPLFPNPGNDKYQSKGPFLSVKDVQVADTGAYICEARNEAGTKMDFASLLVVNDEAKVPSAMIEQDKDKDNESLFVVLHGGGISMYDPTNCRLAYQISGTDIIPGTQNNLVCGESIPHRCFWGEGVVLSSAYIYASQPKLSRVLVVSLSEVVVVDVIPTVPHPVKLHFVPHLDQVWIQNHYSGVLQVVRNATLKKKHSAIRLPADNKFGMDRALSVFLPGSKQFNHGYVTKDGVRGLYKLDLRTLRYVKSVGLTKYNCLPQRVHFVDLYGFIILECWEPVLGSSTGRLILDYLTDEVILHDPRPQKHSFLSPDNQVLLTFLSQKRRKTDILVQNVTQSGLLFHFQVTAHINASDATFFPSQHSHGSYNVYVTGAGESSLVWIDLYTGNTDIVAGVGRPLSSSKNKRTISVQPTDFARYLITPGRESVFVINGESQTVNCRVGRGLTHSLSPSILWIKHHRSRNVTELENF